MELIIQNLNKTYANGVQALKDVNLTIKQGMFGLLGPNGAGKSSLMRTIATLQEADSGTITLANINVLTQKEEVRKTLGYLPQEFGVYPKTSAAFVKMNQSRTVSICGWWQIICAKGPLSMRCKSLSIWPKADG